MFRVSVAPKSRLWPRRPRCHSVCGGRLWGGGRGKGGLGSLGSWGTSATPSASGLSSRGPLSPSTLLRQSVSFSAFPPVSRPPPLPLALSRLLWVSPRSLPLFLPEPLASSPGSTLHHLSPQCCGWPWAGRPDAQWTPASQVPLCRPACITPTPGGQSRALGGCGPGEPPLCGCRCRVLVFPA